MKMLCDVVNHSRLKKQIAEEVQSEQSAKQEAEPGVSSSSDLYSDAGEAYELPDIDPEKPEIQTKEEDCDVDHD